MCITWCPPLSAEQCQEIRSRLSQQGIHERPSTGEQPSTDERHMHLLPASSITHLSTEQDFGNLESSIIVRFPSTRLYFFPERDIFLIDESDTFYQWDGIFAHYVPSTDWKDLSNSNMIMALDPFYDPSVQHIPLPNPRTENDAWMRIIKRFCAKLYEKIKRHPNLEEVILLSSDLQSFGFVMDVMLYTNSFAFPNWVEHMRMGKAKDDKAAIEQEEAEVLQLEKALLYGWEGHTPRITVLRYEYEGGNDQMLATRKAILAYKS